MTEEPKWYKNPQGLVAAATIASMVLAFFYVRERAMWEISSRITAVENRGTNAIGEAGKRLERAENSIVEVRDRINFLERKIDRLELKEADIEERLKGLNSSHQ